MELLIRLLIIVSSLNSLLRPKPQITYVFKGLYKEIIIRSPKKVRVHVSLSEDCGVQVQRTLRQMSEAAGTEAQCDLNPSRVP